MLTLYRLAPAPDAESAAATRFEIDYLRGYASAGGEG